MNREHNIALLESFVADGVRLLDEKECGWYNFINLQTLDMCDFGDCLIGQIGRKTFNSGTVMTTYREQLNKLGIDVPKARLLGFEIPIEWSIGDGNYWDVLKKIWVKVIKQKKKQLDEYVAEVNYLLGW